MTLAAFILPDLGHRTDPLWRIVGTLVVFGLINLFYQASFVPYNWLIVHLRGVKSLEDVRRVSGLGESFGSLGSVVGAILGVAILKTFLSNSPTAYIDLFRWLAVLFGGLFVLDYILLSKGIETKPGAGESYRTLVSEGFQLFRQRGPMRSFLLSFFLYADALLTVQLYIPIYMRERISLSDTSVSAAIAISLSAGAIGAFVFSQAARRLNQRSIIIATLGAWALTLFLFGLISSSTKFFLLISWAGILYGILWSASRAYLVQLVAREMLGRTFGFYAIFERSASIVGPLIWGAIMLLPLSLYWRYFGAFVAMSLLVVFGLLVLVSKREVPVEVSSPIQSVS
jgi:UMF1 family MFS transporter